MKHTIYQSNLTDMMRSEGYYPLILIIFTKCNRFFKEARRTFTLIVYSSSHADVALSELIQLFVPLLSKKGVTSHQRIFTIRRKMFSQKYLQTMSTVLNRIAYFQNRLDLLVVFCHHERLGANDFGWIVAILFFAHGSFVQQCSRVPKPDIMDSFVCERQPQRLMTVTSQEQWYSKEFLKAAVLSLMELL